MGEEDGPGVLLPVLIFGSIGLVIVSCTCCMFYLECRDNKIEQEEKKKKFEAECAALPIYPPPMAYQHQRKSSPNCWIVSVLSAYSQPLNHVHSLNYFFRNEFIQLATG